jgi:hypothetical protein
LGTGYPEEESHQHTEKSFLAIVEAVRRGPVADGPPDILADQPCVGEHPRELAISGLAVKDGTPRAVGPTANPPDPRSSHNQQN